MPLNILEYTVVFEKPIGLISQNLMEARTRNTIEGKVLRHNSRIILFLWLFALSANCWKIVLCFRIVLASKPSMLNST